MVSARAVVLQVLREWGDRRALGFRSICGLVMTKEPRIRRRATVRFALAILEDEGLVDVDRAPGLAAYSLRRNT